MSGETDLDVLLRTMTVTVHPEIHVFVTLPGGKMPDGPEPRMAFREAEGLTLIVTQAEARAHGLPETFPCRMITLDVHSALEAVGFIDRVATALAEAGMGEKPVAGF